MLTKNNQRILRNTLMLYLRMLLAMVVGLYTSRVVLEVLGVEDFGIYYVVAGFVALLGFMQGAMATATQRYFSYDLGESQGANLCSLFNTTLQIHAMLTVCIVLVAETAGYWLVSTQLNIPLGRIDAALCAYHLSIAAFAVQVMTVPLTAILMAHERMGLFSLMGMTDVLLKLGAVLLLPYLTYDKLSVYALLLLGVTLLTSTGYLVISRTSIPAVRLQWGWNSKVFRRMLSYTAWNTWGNLAAALAGHGNNILLNVFFGPAVNASRMIATQANGALNSFTVNVQAAINPQIVKQYAEGDQVQMRNLIVRAAKYNFFILQTLSLPVLFNTEAVLDIWLIEVPPYAAIFLQLSIIVALIDSFSGPLMTAAQATGNIRIYHSVVGGLLLLNVPISYILLRSGMPPASVLWVSIGLSVIALLVRLRIIAPMINLSKTVFFRDSIAKSMFVLTATGLLVLALKVTCEALEIPVFFMIFGSVVCSISSIWLLGLIKSEKSNLIKMIKSASGRIS